MLPGSISAFRHDSKENWRPVRGCRAAEMSAGRRCRLGSPVGLISSLSALRRDSSQFCHAVAPPRPASTSTATLSPQPPSVRSVPSWRPPTHQPSNVQRRTWCSSSPDRPLEGGVSKPSRLGPVRPPGLKTRQVRRTAVSPNATTWACSWSPENPTDDRPPQGRPHTTPHGMTGRVRACVISPAGGVAADTHAGPTGEMALRPGPGEPVVWAHWGGGPVGLNLSPIRRRWLRRGWRAGTGMVSGRCRVRSWRSAKPTRRRSP